VRGEAKGEVGAEATAHANAKLGGGYIAGVEATAGQKATAEASGSAGWDGMEGGFGVEASGGASVTATVGNKNNNASAGVSSGNVAAGASGGVKLSGGNVKANACVKGALGVGAHGCVNVTVPTKPVVNAVEEEGVKAAKTVGNATAKATTSVGKSIGSSAKKAFRIQNLNQEPVYLTLEDLQQL
jgi:hypothetical protein